MGKQGIEILDLDVNQLIQYLNEALAEEWLAFYQYWVGARLIEGPMRSEIEPELIEHANDEYEHAIMVADRIVQLGGTPLLNPNLWKEYSKCDYEEPNDPYVEVILQQNIDGERCAIRRYQQIAEFTRGKDFVTHRMAIKIMEDELEHEQDLEDWLNDIQIMKEKLRH